MPWIEGEFTTNTDSNGLIRNEQLLAAPLSGKLKKYKLKTITGCQGRSHTTHLLITRVNDPTDKLEINVDIKDCLELEREIDPPYRIGREGYDARLTLLDLMPTSELKGSPVSSTPSFSNSI